MNGHLLEILAREKAGMPAEWQVFKFECLPRSEKTIYYELTGAVVPLKAKGQNKGQPNWRKMDRETKRCVVLTVDAVETLSAMWSARTGLCAVCVGEGRLLSRWSKDDGTIYKPCPKCDGTGKAGQDFSQPAIDDQFTQGGSGISSWSSKQGSFGKEHSQ